MAIGHPGKAKRCRRTWAVMALGECVWMCLLAGCYWFGGRRMIVMWRMGRISYELEK